MVMRWVYKLLAAAALFSALAVIAPVAQAGVCPAIGVATDCNFTITRNPDGSFSTAVNGAQPPYDAVEDQLVGIVNNGPGALASIFLTCSGCFGFDGDGAGTFPGSGGPYGPTGYEGPGTSFSIVDVNHGFVNFTGGLASGSSTWFSLENQASLSTTVSAPEPGTLALLGLAATAFGFSRRRKT